MKKTILITIYLLCTAPIFAGIVRDALKSDSNKGENLTSSIPIIQDKSVTSYNLKIRKVLTYQPDFSFKHDFYYIDDIIKKGTINEMTTYLKFLIALLILIMISVQLNKVVKNKDNFLSRIIKIKNNGSFVNPFSSIKLGTIRILLILLPIVAIILVYYYHGNAHYENRLYYAPYIGKIMNYFMPLFYAIFYCLLLWGVVGITNWIKKGYTSGNH